MEISRAEEHNQALNKSEIPNFMFERNIMATNDVIILNQILLQNQNEIAQNMPESEFFELFVSEQILKDFELSYDEIDSGVVGNGGDGGIDSLYVFINGELVHEDSDLSFLKKGITIDLVIIQSKISKNFSEDVIDKFIDVTENLLDLSTPLQNFDTVYNKDLISILQCFRNAYESLASRFPKLIISYYYATKGSTINHTLNKKVEKLKTKVKQLFSSSECNFTFLKASDLLELARRSPQTTYTLNLTENPISSSNQEGFVCLVSLKDYYYFIVDEDRKLQKRIFEANVRGYQGKTPVNEEIQYSLRNPHDEDFWWLNNGVTILASLANLSGKALRIENPEIVNGLQTSEEILKFFNETTPPKDERNLLVRVVVPKKPESRDRIIKATNSQTTIPPATLRSTEKIHRDIEEYLKPFGIFYDRRKNYYKNEGKPINKIISIPYLAQSIMAIVLQRPDDARARPSSLLNRDDDYDQIFNPSYPINLYYFCIRLMQRVEQFLKSSDFGEIIDRKTRGDIRFHIASHMAISICNSINPSAKELADKSSNEVDLQIIKTSANRVFSIYKTIIQEKPVASDKVAKSPEFKNRVITDARELVSLNPI